MACKAHAAFSSKISRTRLFDLTKKCDDKQRAHIPNAVEVADRGSADRGSSDALVRGGDNSTVSALRRWRFKPGTPRHVRTPLLSC